MALPLYHNSASTEPSGSETSAGITSEMTGAIGSVCVLSSDCSGLATCAQNGYANCLHTHKSGHNFELPNKQLWILVSSTIIIICYSSHVVHKRYDGSINAWIAEYCEALMANLIQKILEYSCRCQRSLCKCDPSDGLTRCDCLGTCLGLCEARAAELAEANENNCTTNAECGCGGMPQYMLY